MFALRKSSMQCVRSFKKFSTRISKEEVKCAGDMSVKVSQHHHMNLRPFSQPPESKHTSLTDYIANTLLLSRIQQGLCMDSVVEMIKNNLSTDNSGTPHAADGADKVLGRWNTKTADSKKGYGSLSGAKETNHSAYDHSA